MGDVKALKAKMGSSAEDYARLGLKRGTVEKWEDGLRTDGSSGDYEWWYSDMHLEGGANLVIAIHSKEDMNAELPHFEPFATFEFNTADGRSFTERVDIPYQEFKASTEKCDIHVGGCAFVGDLHEYRITFENENAKANVKLVGTVPSWRPQTGIIEYGDEGDIKFGWIVAVPNGIATADIKVGDEAWHLTGTRYHDHNWGNVSMLAVHHDWYWGRCHVGDYNIISAYITEDAAYGHATVPEFMLVGPDDKFYDDPDKLRFEASEPVIDEMTGKTVHDRITYWYDDDGEDIHFKLTYKREKTIVARPLIEQLPEEMRPMVAATGFDGAYIRFSGKVELERRVGASPVETWENDAVWEMMYFGDMPQVPGM